MPQTIALQRGQITATSGTTNLVFTNTSSGTATRMKIGYLSWTSDFGGVVGRCTFGILRSGASSPNFTAFANAFDGDSGNRTVSFIPVTATMNYLPFLGSAANNSAYQQWLNNTAGILQTRSYIFNSSSNGANYAIYVDDLMLGPSDQVHVAWNDSGAGSRAGIIQYCFVLITES